MARHSTVFTIPPGAPFLDTLVDALLDGRLVPGFDRSVGPLGLADATIYVPTRRAARALTATFAARIGTGASFLPRVLALGALDALEPGLILSAGGPDGGLVELPAAVGDKTRRMILTRLILAWSASVRGAILSIGPGGERETHANEALLVGTTPADAWHLSGELAALLDELVSEGVVWTAVEPLGTDAFDRYWSITLDFLNIAMTQWPAILAAQGVVDPATRYAALIEAEVARLGRTDGRRGPVIVAGAGGTDAATARLIATIARLPHGAVVLPGLDQTLDAAGWAAIAPDSVLPGSASGHPQAALHRLLSIIGIERSEVPSLGVPADALAARARFVSEALRPAETTEAWRGIATGAMVLDRAAALAGVTLIEAADEREEALALAVVLRETLKGDGSAILVTPDRALARRVREEMARWGIEIDDSGGEGLGQTPAGALTRLLLDAVTSDRAPLAILAFLSHPAVRLGRPRSEVEALARRAELILLRGVVPRPALHDPAALVAEARARKDAEHAPGALRRLTDDDVAALDRFLADLMQALDPLLRLGAATPLSDWLAAHEDAVAALARTETDDSALGGPDGAALATLFDDLIEAADPAITLDRAGYAALFERFAAETVVRGPARSHPRLKILGLLEARLLSAERILLGGMDEAVWPPQVRTDAFLNRPMRTALGLTAPERRIAQSAHDFEMAMGQPAVILSRAAKRGGSPTVPSRFLQRMEAIAGDAWSGCRERGRATIALARALDRPERLIAIGRPAPKPPVHLRPKTLSVTRIETLRRDPYAIYADKILRLRPLDAVDAPVGPREYGTLFHDVLSAFTSTWRSHELPTDMPGALRRDVESTFATLLEDAPFRAFMGPRLDRWVEAFVAWEQARRAGLHRVHPEEMGRLEIQLDDGSVFVLTAKADRFEQSHAGSLHVIDYKTGTAPSANEVAAGFAPQLTLEAAMAERGAFPALGPDLRVESADYVKFEAAGTTFKPTALRWKDRTFAEVVESHFDGLQELLNAFRKLETPYVARPFPQFVARFSDYDHLSRVKEWSATGRLGDSEEGGS